MFDGVLNVYKEKGYTSHDVVARLRGILGQKKIGHTGTLDPGAEGVLPVCLGKATRLCDMVTDKQKTYRAVLLLGKETDTQDIWGTVLREQQVETSGIGEAAVRQAVMGFVGEYAQIPPMYSALKVGGKKLYELARAGREVERRPRQVFIYNIGIESIELPRVTMAVCCSKGTYIRTLCHDIGARLGCGGCMEALVRIQAGRFKLEDSLTLAEIENLRDQGALDGHIISIEDMFSHYPAGMTAPQWDHLLHNGNPLKAGQVAWREHGRKPGTEAKEKGGPAQNGNGGGPFPAGAGDGACFRIYDSRGRFIGIYQWEQAGSRLKPQKLFFSGNVSQAGRQL